MTSPGTAPRRWKTWLGLVLLLLLMLAALFASRRGRTWLRIEPARLQLVNLCDSSWRITAKRSGKAELLRWTVTAKATHEVELPAGDYEIEQSLLSPANTVRLRRTFDLRVDPGEEYRWRLVTLLTPTEDADEAGREGGAP